MPAVGRHVSTRPSDDFAANATAAVAARAMALHPGSGAAATRFATTAAGKRSAGAIRGPARSRRRATSVAAAASPVRPRAHHRGVDIESASGVCSSTPQSITVRAIVSTESASAVARSRRRDAAVSVAASTVAPRRSPARPLGPSRAHATAAKVTAARITRAEPSHSRTSRMRSGRHSGTGVANVGAGPGRIPSPSRRSSCVRSAWSSRSRACSSSYRWVSTSIWRCTVRRRAAVGES